MTAIALATSAAAAAQASLLIDPGLQVYSAFNPGGPPQTSGIRIATDRDVDENENGAYTDRADWLEASGTPSEYEVQFVQNSGDTLGGAALSTYHALSSSREITLASIGTANVTVTIRHATRTTDSISFTCTLIADNGPI